MVTRFVPDAGDLIWVNFNPTQGHEQAGHRPAVVLSPFIYNNKTGLCLCVPCSTKRKNYPFEVRLSGERESVALSDQVKNIDWKVRNVIKKGKITDHELQQIRAMITALIGLT